MPGVRLSIFGGGSSYTHHMLYTLTKHVASGDLAGSTITLYDIDRENAQLMAEFGNSLAAAKKLDMKLENCDSVEQALEGADFVLSTFRAGGLDQRYIDETVPLKYGLLGQETSGVGGIFMIARNAETVEMLARTMDRVCPDAFLINYTNPTGMVTDLSQRVSNVKTIGLCDGVVSVRQIVGDLMGLTRNEGMDIEAHASGVNHCTWSLGLRYQGEDLYPRIGELIEEADLDAMEWDPTLKDVCRLYKYYQLLPGSAYYTRYYYTLAKVIKQFSEDGFQHRSQELRKQAAMIREHCRSQLGKHDADFLPYSEEHAAHGDQAIGTIHAIACDTGKVDTVNVRNNGIVPNLPKEAIVEVTAKLTREGPRPLELGPLPDAIAGVVQMVDIHARLAVSAAQTGDRNLVMQAAMAHPCNRDFESMELCLTELFEKNREWLPQF